MIYEYPLGVPSRMNVGQILETHLGWSCSELGDQIKKHMRNFTHLIKEKVLGLELTMLDIGL